MVQQDGAYMQLAHFTFTDTGSRKVNEDSAFASAEGDCGCFAVCDGLGGHGRGDEASRLVCKSFENAYHRQLEQKKDAAVFLADAIRSAQAELLLKQQLLSCPDAMKTTAVLLVINGETAHYAHVGDSRLYLFRNSGLLLHTLDHSVPQMLVNLGEITPDQIRRHEDRNRLLRVLGVPWEKDKFDMPAEPVRITAGDAFLLCTDGFWEWIEESEMAAALKKANSVNTWINAMSRTVKLRGMLKKADNFTALGIWLR